jgi:uncharacterized delta-60 repeat protein
MQQTNRGKRNKRCNKESAASERRKRPSARVSAVVEAVEQRLLFSTGVDPTFNNGSGSTTTPFVAEALSVLSNGEFLASGFISAAQFSSESDFGLQLFQSNGVPDPNFNGGKPVDTSLSSASSSALYGAVQLGSDLLVTGGAHYFSDTGEYGKIAVAAYTMSGNLDTSFGTDDGIAYVPNVAGSSGSVDGPNGSSIVDVGYGLAIQPTTGDIIVVGTQVDQFGLTDVSVSRFKPNGTLDYSFGNDGTTLTMFDTTPNGGPYSQGGSVAVGSDGSIVVAAVTGLEGATSVNYALARYTVNGDLDSSFNNGGTEAFSGLVSGDWTVGLALQPDNKILIGAQDASTNDFSLMRINANGSLDTTFGTNQSAAETDLHVGDSSAVHQILVQPSGQIVATGVSQDQNGTTSDVVAVLNANGTPDPNFDSGGVLTLAGPVISDSIISPDAVLAGALQHAPAAREPDGSVVTSISNTESGYSAGDTVVRRIITDDTPPTATFSGSNVTTAGGATASFNVTYTDDNEISANNVGVGNVTVTGPGGKTLTVQSATPQSSTNRAVLTVTYVVDAPNGTWSAADDGPYDVTLNPQVTDAAGNPVKVPTSFGSFQVEIPMPTGVPTVASFSASTSLSSAVLTVLYTNPSSTLIAGDVLAGNISVTRTTDGAALGVTGATAALSSDDKTLTATYTVTDHGGSFTTADNGTYNVALLGSQIGDASAHFATPASLGSFAVNVPAVSAVGPAVSSFTATAVTTAASSTTLTIVYTDSSATLVPADVAAANISVTRATDGASLSVTNASAVASSDDKTVTATYTVAGHAGSFASTDNGTYSVSLLGSQIGDSLSQFAAATSLGAFQINVPDSSIPIGSFGAVTVGKKTKNIRLTIPLSGGGSAVVTLQGGTGQAAQEIGNNRIDLTLTASAGRPLTFTMKGAAALGNIVINGRVASFSAGSATLQGSFYSTGPITQLLLGNVDGTIASAGAIGRVTAANFSNALLLSGANLGTDGVVGGGDDSFGTGSIASVTVKGTITNSIFAAGVGPGTDGIYGTSDDTGPGGIIRAVLAKGGAPTARFEASLFGTFKLPLKVHATSADPRFVTIV